MKVSVVIPTYKRPALLLRCVEALTRQVFPKHEFEIIIVTDGPDSMTTEALTKFPNSSSHTMNCYSLISKKGPAAARNFGWRKSNSRLILFTDDDCIPDSNWMLAYWNAFLWTTPSRCAFTGKTIVPMPEIPTDYERNISHLSKAEFIMANCACTKSVLEKVGGFDEQFTMAWGEGRDLQFKFIMDRISITPVNAAIVIHPVRKAPRGVSIKDERKGVFNVLLLKKFPSLYKHRIESLPPWNYVLIVSCLMIFIVGIVFQLGWVALGSLAVWFALTLAFAIKRLANTSRSMTHISEMIFTSAAIPVLSIYYRVYGAIKFKAPLFP